MSQFWPRSSSAEEQTLSHIILVAHVFTRALTAGSVLGVLIGTSIYLGQLSGLFATPQQQPLHFAHLLLHSSAASASVTMALMALGVIARMWGRSNMEWKDRAWRLLDNKRQMELDNWIYAGMGVGATASFMFEDCEGMFACVALGSVIGIIGYTGWDSGIKGGASQKNES